MIASTDQDQRVAAAPPAPRPHVFDARGLCDNCGCHSADARDQAIGCEAEGWTNPTSYRLLAVTPGERLFGLTPYAKGMWMLEGAAAAAEAGRELTSEGLREMWGAHMEALAEGLDFPR